MVFRRVLRLWVAFAKFEVTGLAMGAVGWKLYTRNSRFVEYSSADPEFGTPFWRMRNPHNNPPACIDMCERKVPLAKLKTGDEEELVKNFARGVFGGWGFEVQRRMLQEKYRKLEGREKDLWEKEDLERAEYGLGTRIVDHFEVVERTRNKVSVRCGGSPLEQGLRASDGVFSMEVEKDGEFAYFRMKSFFYNSTPEGKDAQPLPWYFQFLHREYAKLWMEMSVRRLLK